MYDSPETGETHDFIVSDVLLRADYTHHGIVVTMISEQGDGLRLHLNIGTGVQLCERIAAALESRYGNSS